MLSHLSIIEIIKLLIQILNEYFKIILKFVSFYDIKKFNGKTRFDHKVVVITGDNSGIEKAAAKAMGLRGAKVG